MASPLGVMVSPLAFERLRGTKPAAHGSPACVRVFGSGPLDDLHRRRQGIAADIEHVQLGVADWNTRVIDEFHAKRGRGVGVFGDNLLLLTTRGAKTGQVRTTPLVYHRDGERYVIAASKGGAPTHPGWYHNLAKHREAEIEVGTEKFKVRATPIPKGPERDRLYEAHGNVYAGFRDYPKKTKRVIPVVVLERVL
jgi:deazaflavin-dependent oxidoreductase (nitroreductase family)